MKRKTAPQSYESQQKKGVTKKPKLTLRSYDHKLLMKIKKSMYQHEKKYIDVVITSGYSTNATINLLNGVVQGTDETSRIGRQINMKSIFIRGSIYQTTSSSTGSGFLRTILVLDQEVGQVSGSGTTMSITDFLVTDALTSLNNLNNRKRFKVLWDDVTPFSGLATANTGGNPTSHEIYHYKKCDITVEYNSNDYGTILDFTKNALYLITYNIGIGVADPLLVLNTRVRFSDN